MLLPEATPPVSPTRTATGHERPSPARPSAGRLGDEQNVRRYCWGLTDRALVKWCRSIAAVPKPTSPAIQSTERSVVSSSSSARSTRWLVIQACGVVPVSARNRRAKVRGDMLAVRARRLDRVLVLEVLGEPDQQRAEGLGVAVGHRACG